MMSLSLLNIWVAKLCAAELWFELHGSVAVQLSRNSAWGWKVFAGSRQVESCRETVMKLTRTWQFVTGLTIIKDLIQDNFSRSRERRKGSQSHNTWTICSKKGRKEVGDNGQKYLSLIYSLWSWKVQRWARLFQGQEAISWKLPSYNPRAVANKPNRHTWFLCGKKKRGASNVNKMFALEQENESYSSVLWADADVWGMAWLVAGVTGK